MLNKVIHRINSSSLQKRFASGAFWSLLGMAVSRGLSLVTAIFVARILGKDGYGEYGIVQSSVTMFQVFASFGVGITATKYVAQYRSINPHRAGRVLGISSAFSVITGGIVCSFLIGFAPFIATSVLNRPCLKNSLAVSAVMLFFVALNSSQGGALSGLESFKTVSIINAVVGLCTCPLIISGAYLLGVYGAVWGMAISALLNWAINFTMLRRELSRFNIKPTINNWQQEFKTLWSFSLPAMLSSLMSAPVLWFGNSLLVNTPEGYSEMGLLSAGNQWFSVLLFLPAIINNSMLPVLAERKGIGDFHSIKKTLTWGLQLATAVLVPIVLVISLFSSVIMQWYGPQFADGSKVLVVLALSALVAGVQNMIGNTLAVMDKMWLHLKMNVVWAAVFITSAFLLINAGLGALGLAVASLISYSLRLVLAVVVVSRWFKEVLKHEHYSSVCDQQVCQDSAAN